MTSSESQPRTAIEDSLTDTLCRASFGKFTEEDMRRIAKHQVRALSKAGVSLEAEAAQDSRPQLARESLVRAIRDAGLTISQHSDPCTDDRGFGELDPFDAADAILAALPSPAPEPPPDQIRRDYLDELIAAGAVTTPMSYDEIKASLDRVERRWRAAQPAPDLDVERLRIGFEQWWSSLAPKLGVPESGAGFVHTDIAWQRITELARLQARESGGEP